jgi:hypothetical protein
MVDSLNFNFLSLNDNELNIGDVIFFNNSFVIITDYDCKNNFYGINYLNDMNDHYIHNNDFHHYEKIEFNYENLRKIIEYSNGYYDRIDINSIKSWYDLYSFYFSI